MNSMTSAHPTASSVFVATPQSGYPMTQGSMSQVPLYPLNQPQVQLMPGNPHGLELPVCVQPAQRALKEGKVLGAVQILIGLIHISLGSILGTIVSMGYSIVSLVGGYPFWGGILFIISGSLSVSSEQQPKSSCLLNASLGLNIVSAICAIVGSILSIIDMSASYSPHWSLSHAPGTATSALLLIFSLLEFSIACTFAHFDCQLVHLSHNNGPLVFPNVYATNPVPIPAPVNSPPPYSIEVQGSQ